MADVSPFALVSRKECRERFLGFLFPRYFVEAGNSALGKKKAALISEHDRFAGGAVLVLLKFKLSEVILRLLTFFRLQAFEILAKPESSVLGG
jgi:hypothetical protein